MMTLNAFILKTGKSTMKENAHICQIYGGENLNRISIDVQSMRENQNRIPIDIKSMVVRIWSNAHRYQIYGSKNLMESP